jgi:mono/diheme cytochrome c family protein
MHFHVALSIKSLLIILRIWTGGGVLATTRYVIMKFSRMKEQNPMKRQCMNGRSRVASHWCVLSCALLLVSGCAQEDGGPFDETRSAARGETVFDLNCGYCHGENGRGPALASIRSLSQTERRNRIANHPISGQIPQRLPAHELSDLIEYIETEK